jgi:hypothetical protein
MPNIRESLLASTQVARTRGGAQDYDLALALQHNLQDMQHTDDMMDTLNEDDELMEEAEWNQLSDDERNGGNPPMGDQEPEQGPHQLQAPNGPAEADVAAGLPQVEEAQDFDMQEQQQPEAQAHPIEFEAEAAEPVPQEQPQLEHEMANPVPERPAAPGTARWLRENADQPVVQGGKDIMTVIFTMLSILAYKNIHKETFDLVMSAVSDLLPPGNHWPRYVPMH